ncbi:MAG: response regulator [Oligoflexales bacterium]
MFCFVMKRLTRSEQTTGMASGETPGSTIDALKPIVPESDTKNHDENLRFLACIANISHELRTPIGTIRGFLDLLKSSQLDDNQKNGFVDIISKNCDHLVVLTEDILDFTNLDSGTIYIHPKEFSVLNLVNDIIASQYIECTKNRIQVDFSPSDNIPEFIEADPSRLRQIIANMVNNAIKYSFVGGKINIFAFIGTKKLGGQTKVLNIEVQDFGCGISEENKKKLFVPFYRFNSNASKIKGYGLGLSFSKKLAQHLGGDIKLLKSELGKGSIFIFKVPIKIKEKSKVHKLLTTIHGELKEEAQTVLPSNEKPLENKKILVVEDDTDNQHVMQLLLKKAGAEVSLARNGREGLEKAIKNGHDLILMDMKMPELDGYSATYKLKEGGYSKPIIAVTAHALEQEREKCFKCGCVDFIAKPLDFQALISIIKKHLKIA